MRHAMAILAAASWLAAVAPPTHAATTQPGDFVRVDEAGLLAVLIPGGVVGDLNQYPDCLREPSSCPELQVPDKLHELLILTGGLFLAPPEPNEMQASLDEGERAEGIYLVTFATTAPRPLCIKDLAAGQPGILNVFVEGGCLAGVPQRYLPLTMSFRIAGWSGEHTLVCQPGAAAWVLNYNTRGVAGVCLG